MQPFTRLRITSSSPRRLSGIQTKLLNRVEWQEKHHKFAQLQLAQSGGKTVTGKLKLASSSANLEHNQINRWIQVAAKCTRFFGISHSNFYLNAEQFQIMSRFANANAFRLPKKWLQRNGARFNSPKICISFKRRQFFNEKACKRTARGKRVWKMLHHIWLNQKTANVQLRKRIWLKAIVGIRKWFVKVPWRLLQTSLTSLNFLSLICWKTFLKIPLARLLLR